MNILKASLITPSIILMLSANLFGQESYTIQNNTLQEALEIIAKKAKLPYIVEESLIQGKKSPSIKDIQGVQEALNAILKNTSLKAIIKNDTIIIKKISSNASEYNNLKDLDVIAINNAKNKNGNFVSLNDLTISSSQIRSEITNNKIVINNDKIVQFNDATAGEVLRRLPGITFSGNPSESKEPRLRGLDSQYTQILINGQRVPGAGRKRDFQIDLIPTNMIERIEIIRTPTSNMDSQGIAGTLNVILKQTAQSRILTTTLGLNKLGNKSSTPNASITYGDKINDLSYLLSLNIQERNKRKYKTKEKFNADGTPDSADIEEEEQNYKEIFFSTRLNYDFNENNKLSFNPNYSVSKEEKNSVTELLDENEADGFEYETEEQKRTNFGFDSTYSHNLNDQTNLSLSFLYQKSKEDIDTSGAEYKADGSLDKEAIETEDTTDEESTLKFAAKSLLTKKHILEYGIDYMTKKRQKSSTEFEIENNVTTDKTDDTAQYLLKEKRINAFLQDEFKINDNHILTSGIRYEWSEFKSDDATGEEQKSHDGLWNPSLNYLYHINKNNKLKIGLARTVNRPSFDKINPFKEEDDGTLSDPDKVGNPDLKPEISYGLDISIEHYFDDSKGLLIANFLYRDIKDRIEDNTSLNTTNNRYEEKAINQGDATIKGLEIEANYDLSAIIPNFRIISNITFMDGEIEDNITGKTIPVSEMPDYVYNIGFEHEFYSSYKWGMNYNYTSKITDVSYSENEKSYEYTKPEKRLDLFVNAKLNNMHSINFSANNLLKLKKETKEVSYKDGIKDEIQYETRRTQRVFMLTLVSKF